MNLEALGNLGEFIGSIAVLVSLVYLAIQIRKSTETERTSTYQSIVSDFGQMNQSLAGDPELIALYIRGLEDFDALDATARARISQVFYMTFRYFENMYYQHEKGYLEDEVWLGWKRLMLNYFANPGFQTWWTMRRDVFGEPFTRFLETTSPDRRLLSYPELTAYTAS